MRFAIVPAQFVLRLYQPSAALVWETLRSIAALLLSRDLLLVANGLFGTLLGIRSKLEGFSTEATGFIMAD